mgnify:CR=1 FL=1
MQQRESETTTGPLGQGIANAVGFALAESHLAAEFNKPGYNVVDHYTYALCGDGCLMEGVSAEAASLAGTMKLGKLIVLYDSNRITIEGSTDIAFKENVRERFDAYGWQTLLVEDGNDVDAIDKAIKEAKAETKRPTIIEIKTTIGYGAPNKQGKASAHGEPLGDEEIALAKKNLGWEYTEPFYVPEEVKENGAAVAKAGKEANDAWCEMFKKYRAEFPEMAEKWDVYYGNKLPDLLNNEDFWTYEGDLATRASSEKVLNKLSKIVPNLFGGSADLGPSNKSVMKDREYYSPENPSGSNVHFGIREFAMTAMANAIALHGGLRPYIAGFFVFSDYMKAAMRISRSFSASCYKHTYTRLYRCRRGRPYTSAYRTACGFKKYAGLYSNKTLRYTRDSCRMVSCTYKKTAYRHCSFKTESSASSGNRKGCFKGCIHSSGLRRNT